MSGTILKTVSVALAAMVICAPAQAQQLMNFITRTTIPIVIQCPGCNERNRSNGEEAGSTQTPEPRVTAPQANASALRFVPDMTVRQRNLAQFVAQARQLSPENGDQLAGLFGSTDVFALISQGLAPKGLRIDDVADTYAVYWIVAWEASRGISGDTSRDQAQAVKGQVTAALLATPQLVGATAAQKQELAEALLVQTMLISASMDSAAGDPAQLEGIAGSVRQGAQGMGIDLDAMTLTPEGFVPAR